MWVSRAQWSERLTGRHRASDTVSDLSIYRALCISILLYRSPLSISACDHTRGHSSLIFVHRSHTVYQAKAFREFRLYVRQSGKGVWGVEVACEAKLPHGGLSMLELMYIFPCFAAMNLGWGKCLSSEAGEIGYQCFIGVFFGVNLWRLLPNYKSDSTLN